MRTTALILLGACCTAYMQAPGLLAADDASARDLPHTLEFKLGDAEFAPGDGIRIESVRGTEAALAAGGTYSVSGTYTLRSRDEADLALFVTTTNPVSTAIEPRQTVRVKKGQGTFTLVNTIRFAGYPHVSFYPVPGGSSFGGVYFGNGAWLLSRKGFSYHDSTAMEPKVTHPAPPPDSASLETQNRRILEYLGAPVAAPANLDPAYTRNGLITAMHSAAQKAGIRLTDLQIEDSEFPFLVGIICPEGDYPKMLAEIKKMAAYEEQGGVSSQTCRAINIIPWRAFPSESAQRIGRRMTLREQMFYDQLSRKE